METTKWKKRIEKIIKMEENKEKFKKNFLRASCFGLKYFSLLQMRLKPY